MRAPALLAIVLVLAAGPAAIAKPGDKEIEAAADVSGAVFNDVEITQAAHSGRLTAASCQLVVAGSVVVGASGTSSALSLIVPNVTVSPPVLPLQRIEHRFEGWDNATSSCLHTVESVRIEIQREEGWGAPAAVDERFWPRSLARVPYEPVNITLNATAGLGDVGSNNATIRILQGAGNAASACQIVIAAHVVITAMAFAEFANATGGQASALQQPEPAATPGEGIATCEQRIRAAQIVLPRSP